MSIRFFCPLGHRLQVPDKRAGKKGRCPMCGQRLIVPEASVAKKKRHRTTVGTKQDSGAAAADEQSADGTVPAQNASPPTASLMDGRTPALNEAAGSAEPALAIDPAVQIRPSIRPPPLVVESPANASPSVVLVVPSHPAAAPSTNGTVATAPAPADNSSRPLRQLRWFTWARSDALDEFAVDGPTPRQLEVVYWLACLLPFAVVFCAAPTMPYLEFAGAPLWAQFLLCTACLQLAYAAWLATVPDWSSVRVGAYLFGAVAIVSLLAAVGLAFASEASLSWAGLANVRATASAWCGLTAVVNGFASAACRWLERRWRAGVL
ncbi:MAG TPA: hypothetical protein VFI31_27410 [Pirellulales bacterium]|nr:hypothetical protein [Pirellulales bacterium]